MSAGIAARERGGGSRWIAWVCVAVVAAACAPSKRRRYVELAHTKQPAEFQSVSMCVNCHVGIGAQYYRSMHAQSLSNPVFRGAYYRLFLPQSHARPKAFRDEPMCLKCHAPVAYLKFFSRAKPAEMPSGDDVDCTTCHSRTEIERTLAAPGVVCDICHRIESFDGPTPGNGNYVARPGAVKFGPFPYEGDFHRQYNELQTKSEFCAICHNSSNRFGVDIRTTYTEWKEGPYAARGIQCQDCHMNAQGFLTEGKAVYERGKAAYMTVGDSPDRDKLFTHRFFGAHAQSQIDEALTLTIEAPEMVLAGDDVEIRITVDNSKAGHSIPTGSVELRSVWLDVRAEPREHVDFDYEIPVSLIDSGGYGVVGASPGDDSILDGIAPDGSRIYRVVFTGANQEQELINFDARARVFDNRLLAGEKRTERYMLEAPAELQGWITIEATLYYLRYPPAFAKRAEIRTVDPVPFDDATAEILVR